MIGIIRDFVNMQSYGVVVTDIAEVFQSYKYVDQSERHHIMGELRNMYESMREKNTMLIDIEWEE